MSQLGKNVIFWLVIMVLVIALVHQISPSRPEDVTLDEFIQLLQAGRLESVQLSEEEVEGTYWNETRDAKVEFKMTAFPEVVDNIFDLVTEFQIEQMDKPSGYTLTTELKGNPWRIVAVFSWLLPVALIIGLWFLFIRQMQVGGSKAMSFGKSRARLNTDTKNRVTFNDVAGCDEAKEELQEVIEFLKDPRKFQKLGGKIPKGVLLFGSPGTGKTLLARAVAGEANVPFFSISGSDFVEMFVGVGASRVRDLFEQGKKNAPCIIFMDEIDAVGRHRFAGIGGGHDEREQTLNQLLVEMDGFNANDGVILIAATNRPDVLDPALLRPGRFDRQIVVDAPDLQGRVGILKVHTRNIVLDRDVDIEVLARRTPGFSGADLANTVNEAALLAARRNKDAVDMIDFEDAIDRVMAGPEKKSKVMSPREKKVVAYHESGHALMYLYVDEIDPLHKVSILPRGHALGYTMQLPMDDKYLTSKPELLGNITALLGGRVAEELTFGDITTGASNDLERATAITHRMVCEFGMSDKLGPLTFGNGNHQVFLGRDLGKERSYSEEIAFEIDKEIRNIVDSCYARAKKILEDHRDELETLANALLEKEVLDRDEVYELLGISVEDRKDTQDEPPSASADVSEKKKPKEDEGTSLGGVGDAPQPQPA